MFKINKKTEYALIALKHIYQKDAGQLSSAKEICEAYNTPFDATSRVLQVLASNRWLKSEQGAHGGYILIKSLDEMSMKQLCEMIEGPQAIVKCLGNKATTKSCDLLDTCNMISPLSKLNNMLVDFLDQVKVSDLVGLDTQTVNFQSQLVNEISQVEKR